jgi:hypothetical protein
VDKIKSIEAEIAAKEEEKRRIQEQLKGCQGMDSAAMASFSLLAVAGDDGRGDAALGSSTEISKHQARPRVGSTQTPPEAKPAEVATGGEDGVYLLFIQLSLSYIYSLIFLFIL